MEDLTDTQREGLRILVERGATPGSGYYFPTWQMDYLMVDGRTFEGLRRRGLVEKMPTDDWNANRRAYQLTEEGLREASAVVRER